MNQDLVDLLANLTVASKINAGDVLRLRDEVWTEDHIAQSVVEALYDLNDRCRDVCPEWQEFLYEAVDHFLLHQTPPMGFLDEKGAAWLRTRIGRTGRVKNWFDMELLVCLLEHSENAPEWLKVWALAQVEETIISGTGPTRDANEPVPNRVDSADVELLRRLIFAEGGEGAIIVGSSEADMLFRIKDKTLASENAPGWLTLFVQGVGNHLMAHSDYRPLSADEAARLNGFMEDNTPHLFGFLRRTLPGQMLGKGSITEVFAEIFGPVKEHFGDEADIAASRALTGDESRWLKEAIAVDGQTDDYEKALLTFIIEETGNVPCALEGLVVRRAG